LGYTGLATDGGLAELVKVPTYQLHHLPLEVSFEQGALIEPLAVALHGLRLSKLKPAESVAVFGCGAIGLFALLWARHAKAARTFATDVIPARLKSAGLLADVLLNPAETDVAAEIIRQTENLGPDVVYECSGNDQAQAEAVNTVRKGGRIVLLGMGYQPTPIMFMQLTMKEIEIKGSMGYSPARGSDFTTAIEAVRSHRIDPLDIPVKTFALDAVARVFPALAHGEIAKAIILP
jgi:(R,R)-butanediol dehydrogenase/meso-butanediol dehydrogenase/diacetyl reductase